VGVGVDSVRCRICGNESDNVLHVARDLRHGVGGEYEYVECFKCGCVQIRDYPPEFQVLYPPEYYAHQPFEIPPVRRFRNYFRTKWIDYGLTGRSWVGWVLSCVKPVPPLYTMLGRCGVHKSSAMLDVGCGNGTFLFWLSRAGFTNLTGVDPHIAGDVRFSTVLNLFKRSVEDISGRYDVITLNHSFEHMKDPGHVMRKLFELLEDEGLLVVSVPVVGYAWRMYGVCWVGLDPPRHFYLHTPTSLQILCSKAGFRIVDVTYNSDGWQFAGSELNRRSIPERDLVEGKVKLSQVFTKKEIASFRSKADQLNKIQQGDQAIFFLRKNAMNPTSEVNIASGTCK
jgi:SAM-dependent methyltransferase